MADITALNLAASIDALVQQYRTQQRQPIVTLENRKTTLKARLTVLSELKSRLSALNSISSSLSLGGANSAFLQYAVSSTHAEIVTATAGSAASLGTHTLLVSQLAKSDTVLSAQVTNTGTEIIAAGGAGTREFRLTVNGVNTTVQVTLAAGDTNSAVLGKIAAAVNAGTSGATASVVMDTPTTSKIVFQSKTTGSAQAVSMADTSGSLLAQIGLTASVISGRTAVSGNAAGFIYSDTGLLDAKFALDGIQMVRSSNAVQDALAGVAFQLKGTQAPTDDPVVLAVDYDKEKIRGKVEELLTAYNDAISYIAEKTAVDPSNNVREILAGDTVFRNLRIQMRGIAGGSVGSVLTGNPSLLSQIGITAAKDGTLTLSNTATFDAMMTEGVQKVADLFTSASGVAVRMKSLMEGFVTTGGQMDASKTGVDGQITSITSRVKRLEEQVTRKVNRYRDEFVRLQNTLAIVTQQQQIMDTILSGIS
jgi:flagellar hook-associated protein 2